MTDYAIDLPDWETYAALPHEERNALVQAEIVRTGRALNVDTSASGRARFFAMWRAWLDGAGVHAKTETERAAFEVAQQLFNLAEATVKENYPLGHDERENLE
ncbi:MAG TPA: hypothetical protein VKQ05_12940 [Gemmatimonadales bacterium]|nr:hypothetical protein [Gemmatimonadales bacterium]